MNRINTICIIVTVLALSVTIWRMDSRIGLLEAQNAALVVSMQHDTSVAKIQTIAATPVASPSTPKPERARTETVHQIDSRKFVQEHVPSLGRVKYPLQEMVTFIKVRNTSIGDNEAKHIVMSIAHAAEEFKVPATVLSCVLSLCR